MHSFFEKHNILRFLSAMRPACVYGIIISLILTQLVTPVYAADIQAELDSNDGSSAFTVQPTGGASDVVTIDSTGNIMATGCVRLDAGGTECTDAENLVVDGNIAIGTTTPDQLLHIENTAGVSVMHLKASTAATIDVNAGNATDAVIRLQEEDTAEFTLMHDASGSEFQIRDGSESGTVLIAIPDGVAANRFIVDTAGNVGIGTNDPRGLFDLDGDMIISIGTGTFSDAGSALADLYVEGDLEVDGNVYLGDNISVDNITIRGTMTQEGETVQEGPFSVTTDDAEALKISNAADSVDYFIVDTANTNIEISNVTNVGINSASPSELLDINGDVRIGQGTFDNDGADEDLYVTGNLEVDGNVWLGDAVTDNLVVTGSFSLSGDTTYEGPVTIDTTTDEAFLVRIDGDSGDRFTIDTANNYVEVVGANVGIGDTDPGAALVVGDDTARTKADGAGDGYMQNDFEVDGALYTDYIYPADDAAIAMVLGDNAGDDFTIDSTAFVVEGDNGYVGMGTNTPSSILTVYESTDTSGTNVTNYTGGITLQNADATASQYSAIRFEGAASGDGAFMRGVYNADNSNTLQLGNYNDAGTDAVAMTIDNNLNVGIADVTPTFLLQVGTGVTSRGLDGANDLYVADDVEIDGDLYVDGSSYLGDDASVDNLTVLGDFNLTGDTNYEGPLTVDTTEAEALLVRADGDGGDVFTVDTAGGDVTFGSGTADDIGSGLGDILVGGSAEIDNNLYVDNYVYVDTAIYGDSDGIYFGTGTPSRPGIDQNFDAYFAGDVEIDGNFYVDGSSYLGDDASVDTLTVTGDFFLTGDTNYEGAVLIDTDEAEAFLVRADGDGGDVLTVDTVSSVVTVGGVLYVDNTIYGSDTDGLDLSGDATADTPDVFITPDGNVGVGVAAPTVKLQVNDGVIGVVNANASDSSMLRLFDTVVNQDVTFEIGDTDIPGLTPKNLRIRGGSSTGDFLFSPSGSHPMALMLQGASGNVGLGLATPEVGLELRDATLTSVNTTMDAGFAGSVEIDGNLYVDTYLYVNQAIYGDSQGVFIGTGTPSRSGIDAANDLFVAGDVEIDGDLYVDGSSYLGDDASVDNLTVLGDFSLTGDTSYEGPVSIDTDEAEAFLVRADEDGGDVFMVDTVGGDVTFGSGTADDIGSGLGDILVGGSAEIDNNLYVDNSTFIDNYLYVNTSIYGDSDGIYFGTGTPSRAAIDQNFDAYFAGDVEIDGNFFVDGSTFLGDDAAVDNLTVLGDLSLTGDTNYEGPISIDTDEAEAFLVRADGDTNDVFTVDSVGGDVTFGSGTADDIGSGLGDILVGGSAEIDNNLYVDNYFYVDTAIYGDSQGIFFGTGTPSRSGIDQNFDAYFAGDVEIDGNFYVDGSSYLGDDAAVDTLTVTGDFFLFGNTSYEQPVIIDTTSAEAFQVRRDGDSGDIFNVDSLAGDVSIGVGTADNINGDLGDLLVAGSTEIDGNLYVDSAVYVDGTVYGNTTTGLRFVADSTNSAPPDVVILTNGNMGVGEDIPEELLEVQGAQDTDAVIALDADEGDEPTDTWKIRSDASDNNFYITSDTSDVLTVTSTANVGINDTTPSELLNVGTGDSNQTTGAQSAYITNELEVDGNIYADDYLYVNTAIYGDSEGVFIGTGTPSRPAIDESRDLYVSGDMEVDGVFYADGDVYLGDAVTDNLTIIGTLSLSGNTEYEGPVTIDTDEAEALLVRTDEDGADVFTVDTVGGDVTFGSGTADDIGSGLGDILVGGSAEIDNNLYVDNSAFVDNYLYVNTAIYGDSQGIFFGTGTPSRTDIDQNFDAYFAGDVEIDGNFYVDGSTYLGDNASVDTLTVTGDFFLEGNTSYEQPVIIDTTAAEALLVRRDGDGGDIFNVDSLAGDVSIGVGTPDDINSDLGDLLVAGSQEIDGNLYVDQALYVDGAIYSGSATNGFGFVVGQEGVEPNMVIDGTGNVGIGEDAPEELLEIQGAQNTDAVIALDADEGDDLTDTWKIRSDASDNNFYVANDTSDLVAVTSGGNVGIGDATPSELLNVGTGDSNQTTGAQSAYVTDELEVDGNIYADQYLYVDTAIYGDSQGIFFGTGVPSRPGIDQNFDAFFAGDVEIDGTFYADGDVYLGDAVTDNLIVVGTLSLSGSTAYEGPVTIDTTESEALLVRRDQDGGDIFTVDTTGGDVRIGEGAADDINSTTGDLLVAGSTEIDENLYVDGALYVDNAIYGQDAGGLRLVGDGTNAVATPDVTIAVNGNVGLNDTTPSELLNVGDGDSSQTTGPQSAYVTNELEVDGNVYADQYLYVDTAIYGDSDGIYFGTGVPSRPGIDQNFDAYFAGDVEIDGAFYADGDVYLGDAVTDTLTVIGTLSLSGNTDYEGPITIDTTESEAFLVRQDEDGGDIFTVDTSGGDVTIGEGTADDINSTTGDLLVAGSAEVDENLYVDGALYVDNAIYGQDAGGLRFIGDGTDAATPDMTIAVDGNVGIGEDGPEELLEVQGVEGTDAVIALDADDGDDPADTWKMRSDASDNNFYLTNDTSDLVAVTTAGNVGINNASAGEMLNVGSGSSSETLGAESAFITDELEVNGSIYTDASLYVDGAIYSDDATNGFRFVLGSGSTTPTMVLDASGNLGIGDTSPSEVLNVGSGDSSQTTGPQSAYVTNELEVDGNIYADQYLYVDTAIYGDSDGIYFGTGVPSRPGIDQNFDAFFAGDVEIDGTFYADGDVYLGDAVTDTLTVIGTLSLSGNTDYEGPITIDTTEAEAFLVRADGDSADVFTVDTSDQDVTVGGELYVDYTIYGSATQGLAFSGNGAGEADMVIDVNGQVGVGVDVPDVPLHVAYPTTGANTIFTLESTAAQSPRWSLVGTDRNATYGMYSGDDFAVYGGGGFRVLDNASGDVLTALNANATENYFQISIDTSNRAYFTGYNSASPVEGDRILTFDTSNNVGIGVWNPGVRLEVGDATLSSVGTTLDMAVQGSVEINDSLYVDNYLYVDTAIYGDSQGIFFGTGTPSRADIDQNFDAYFAGDVEIDGAFYADGDVYLGDAVTDNLIVVGSLSLAGNTNYEGPITIDTTEAEALLIRRDEDGGDIFTVDTSGGDVSIGEGTADDINSTTGDLLVAGSTEIDENLYVDGALYVDNTIYGQDAGGLRLVGDGTNGVATPDVTIAVNGNVGIADTTPSELLNVGTGDSNQTTGAQSAYVTNELEVDGNIYADQYLYVDTAIYGDSQGIFFGTGTPSRTLGIDQNFDAYFAGDVEIDGTFYADGDVYLGDAVTDNLTIVGTLSLSGNTNYEGPITIDTTEAEAFLVRADGDSADVFTVDTSAQDVTVGGELYVDYTIYGSATQGLVLSGNNEASSDMVITTSGTVGIGTTIEPTGGALVVNGDLLVDSGAYITRYVEGVESERFSYIQMQDDIVVQGRETLTLRNYSADSGDAAGVDFFLTNNGAGAGNFRWHSGALTETMRLTYDGNLGVGVNNPLYKVHVSGDIYTDDSLYVEDYIYGNTTSGDLRFVANAEGNTDPDMVITSGGNVGIGDTSPSELLNVGDGDSNQTTGPQSAYVTNELEVDGNIYADEYLYVNTAIYGDSQGIFFGTGTPSRTLGIDQNFDAYFAGDVEIDGTFYADGDVYLGDAVTDNLIVVGTLSLSGNTNYEGPITIDTTESEAFLVRSDLDSADVFTVDTVDLEVSVGGDLYVDDYIYGNTSDGILRFVANTEGNTASDMVITPNGNVGIGVVNPSNALEVSGTIEVSNGITSSSNLEGNLNLNTANGRDGIALIGRESVTFSLDWDDNATDERFTINANEFFTEATAPLFVVVEDGTAGMGVATPEVGFEMKDATLSSVSSTFDAAFAGSVEINENLYVDNALYVDDYIYGNTSTGILSFVGSFAADTQADLVIDSTGFVGIGDSSPSELLNVGNGNSTQALGAQSVYITNDLEVGGVLYGDASGLTNVSAGTNIQDTQGDTLVETDTAGDGSDNRITFTVGAVEAMRIENTTNVGIGDTSPSELLNVGTGDSSETLGTQSAFITGELEVNRSIYTNESLYVDGAIYSDDATNGFRFVLGSGSTTPTMVLDASGNLGIGDTSPSEVLNVGSGDSSQTTGPQSAYVTNELEVDGNIYADQYLYVDTAIYGDSQGIFFGTGTPSRTLGIDQNFDAYFAGDVEIDGTFYADGDVYLGDAVTDNLIVVGTLSLAGNTDYEGPVTIDTTEAEAFLVRVDEDGGDIFTVDTSAQDVTVGGELYVDYTIYGSATQGLAFSGNGAGEADMLITTAGSVGIGTDTPSQLFVVQGNALIGTPNAGGSNGFGLFEVASQSSGSTFDGISIYNTATQAVNNAASILFITGGNVPIGSGGVAKIEAIATNVTPGTRESELAFFTDLQGSGQTEKMRINGDGNVGIGVDNPLYKMHVSGDIYTDDSLYVEDYIYGNTTSGDLRFVANAEGNTDPDMVITSGGNVGIGDTSPSELLNVGDGDSNQTTGPQSAYVTNELEVDGNIYADEYLYVDTAIYGDSDGVFFGTGVPSQAAIDQARDVYFSGDAEIDGALYVDGFIYGDGSQITNITSSQWTTSGSDIYYDSGNVGVGDDTPSELLNVGDGDSNKTTGAQSAYVTNELEVDGNIYADSALYVDYSIYGSATQGLSLSGNNEASTDLWIAPDGNVGIGGSDDIVEAFTIIGGNIQLDNNQGIYARQSAGAARPLITWASSDNISIGDSTGTDDIYLNVAGHTGALVLAETSGNAGVGDSSAEARLEVSANGGSNMYLMLSSDDNNDGDALIVNAEGSLGLGNSSPLELFHVGSGTPGETMGASSAYITNDLEVDGIIYGDGSGITGITEAGGWTDGGTTIYNTTLTDNVGVGITVADYQLHVSGDMYTDASLYVEDYIYGNTSTGQLRFVADTTGGTDPDMIIDANGNIGMGEDAPSQRLHTVSPTGVNNFIRIETTDADNATADAGLLFAEAGLAQYFFQWDGSADTLQLFNPNNGSTPFNIVSDDVYFGNNVGIADNSPTEWLDVGTGSSSEALGPYSAYITDELEVDGSVYVEESLYVDGAIYSDDATNGFRFVLGSGSTTPTMVLDASGNLGIGDTSPSEVLNVGSGDSDQSLGASSAYITNDLEVDGYAYVETAIYGDSQGIFFGTGTPSRTLGIDQNFDAYFAGDVEIDGTFYADGDVYLGDAVTDNLIVVGTLSLAGNTDYEGPVTIDTTEAEAFLVRVDEDGGDIFTVDTSAQDVTVGGELYVDYTIYGSATQGLAFSGNGAGEADMVIDTNGNLGIGLSGPRYTLDINGKMGINGSQVIYHAQAEDGFTGSLILGDGGTNLNNTAGTEAYFNTSVGISALSAVTRGARNTAVGAGVLGSNTTGNNNTAVGRSAMANSSLGSNNTAVGYFALEGNTSGGNNVAHGYNAGRLIADGATDNQTGTNSIFIGYNTKALADGNENQIVIGYDATGLGSNSVMLGNNSTSVTALMGNVGMGVTSPGVRLEVGDATLSSVGTTLDVAVEGSVEINDSLYVDNYLYVDTAIYGDSDGIYFGTGTPSRAGIDQSHDVYMAGDLEVDGAFYADGDVYLGDAVTDTLTVVGTLSLAGNTDYEGPVTIDTTEAEAFLVRADGDSADVFTVDTSDQDVTVGGELYVDYTIYGSATQGLAFSGNGAGEADMVIDADGNVGIGETTMQAKLHIADTTQQLRLDYDSTNFATFTVESDGDLTVSPSGTYFQINGANINTNGNQRLTLYSNSNAMAQFSSSYGITMRNEIKLYSSANSTSGDVRLLREDANILALHDTDDAVEFRIHKSRDAVDDEFATLGWINNTDVFGIETEAIGVGTVRNIAFLGGNVGMGVTAPGVRLEVGDATLSSVGTTLDVAVEGSVEINDSLYVDNYLYVDTAIYGDSDGIYFGTGTPSQAAIDRAEDIYAAGDMEIDGALYVDGYIYGDGSQITNITSSQWTTSGSNIYYDTGNVGIGADSATAALEINNESSTATDDMFKLVTDVGGDESTVFLIEADGEAFSDVGFSTPAADVAEHFPLAEPVEHGDVVVIDVTQDETLKRSTHAYDRLVAGVISTDPGVRLGKDGQIVTDANGDPHYVALAGRVPVKVVGPVNRGDLLTTSDTVGHAMACDDMTQCMGAIVGKALTEPDEDGKVIAIISLQ